ncbi:hypothetical protein LJC16_01145 [Bacteroidales bacterium OttesenSCG-928-C19]|nr:hypothetical protein [Bacteroidales bacterium OttesenSCG-928-C19]
MGKNSFKTPEPTQEPAAEESLSKKESPAKKSSKSSGGVRSWFDGTILTRKFILKSIPMFFLIFILGITFIANRYVIEKTSLDISKMKNRIDELQMRHTQVNGEYMRSQKITEIARKLDTLGIKESTSQPKKIVIKD